MVNRSKNIGTAGETAVVRYLRDCGGWPNAERRALAGSADLGDIIGTPGICWEVKAGKAAETATDGDLRAWQDQTDTETRNSRSELGVLVCKRKAVGAGNAGSWWAWTRLSWLVEMGFCTGGHADVCDCQPHDTRIDVWVRMTLREMTWLLRQGGYGSPLPTSDAGV